MKFSSLAMLAFAATPISMVSAQTVSDVLADGCAELVMPMPAKSKGAKGDTRRQLQTKSSGKGSKSSGSTCTPNWIAIDLAGDPSTFYDACGLIPPVATPLDKLGSLVLDIAVSTGNLRIETTFVFDAGELSDPPVVVDVLNIGNADTLAYLNKIKGLCEFGVPVSPPAASMPSYVTGPGTTDGLLLDIGLLPAVGGIEYRIYYFYVCDEEFDDSNLDPFVAEFLEAYNSGGDSCLDTEVSGKKSDL